MDHNPYAPPGGPTDMPPKGLVFSPEGVETVASMAKWMRALSTFYYTALALVVLGGGCASIGAATRSGVAALALMIGVALGCALLALPAMWLREAAEQFEHGVMGDDESALGQGFRKLRAFFIMFGIFAIIGLLGNIFNAVKAL